MLPLKSYYLADLPPDVVALMQGEYPAEVFTKALAAHIKACLRYDNATGTLYHGRRWISRFSDPSDHQPAQDLAQVAYAMTGKVRNSCSRIVRGYAPL